MALKQDKILITGAAGFIGSHLFDSLIKDEIKPENITLLLEKGSSIKNLPKLNFKIVRGDIRDKKVIKEAVKDVNMIYHLAAKTMGAEDQYMSINLLGTKTLLEAIKKQKIKKFVFFSTIAIYGLPAFSGEQHNITEKTKKQIIGKYAKSKYRAEQEILKAHKNWGLPYVIIRPTTVYGPRDKAGVYQLYRAIKNHYYILVGNGDNKIDYVYVSDLVEGVMLASKHKKTSGSYILGANKPIRFKQLADTISTQISTKYPSIHLPKTIALKIAYLLELLAKILKSNNPFSPGRVQVMTSNYYFNSQKAKDELSYNPNTSLTEGIKETVNWIYRNEK